MDSVISKTSDSDPDRSCRNDLIDDDTPEDQNNDGNDIKEPVNQKKGIRFWTILVALSITGLLTALEQTITSTALPTIISSLGSENQFIWVVSAYFLTRTAFTPLYGQLADIFGRRYPIIVATATFTLGSGICGGASNTGMLVAGRAIQGIGAGGVNVLTELVVCDLVPLRERGNYLAFVFGLLALGSALGPLFGGLIVQHSTWRWVFYLNLPIGGAALILLVLFLHVKYEKQSGLVSKLLRIDFVGNAIFVASVIPVLIALSWAGTLYAWSSFRVIVPLVLGFAGLTVFVIFEGSSMSLEPTIPLRLFSNRTSAAAFALTFIHSVNAVWTLYFLPVYFQGVLGSTPARSGVQLVPTIVILAFFAAISGTLLTKFGRYRIIQLVGFACMMLGFGLFSLLDVTSSTAVWAVFQSIEAAGVGLVIPTLLQAVQADLAESDAALATSTWAFIRSFGFVCGATIPAAIFNNRFDQLAGRISDPGIAAQLSGGKAYEHATKIFLDSLLEDGIVREQVIAVFTDSLKRTWQIAIGFAALGLLLVFVEREVKLRKVLDTQFGMVEDEKKNRELPVDPTSQSASDTTSREKLDNRQN